MWRTVPHRPRVQGEAVTARSSVSTVAAPGQAGQSQAGQSQAGQSQAGQLRAGQLGTVDLTVSTVANIGPGSISTSPSVSSWSPPASPLP